ncbi:putative integrase catalytic domain-containing protein [Phytophthora infestans]|uniref:Putative integrase catalytic domain-containing protein n=1 Tax=Phytophthora infestans TaxID=4787 RepID=A0A833W5B0_PHYIN|nr:putative integrase catalytic domain-containing protein [Phytophthora infestans]KAF4029107.1 putative integrase catalytic domain-containing protein [Phytophthora infestans]
MTVSHRTQADGQSERQICTLEDALRCSISHYGDDWVRWPPCIEFAHATGVNTSTGRSPMEVDTGRRPIPALWAASDQASFVSTRTEAMDAARRHLVQAQERQRRYYDRGRQDERFSEGDLVYVKARLLSINRMARPDYDPERDPTVNKLLPKWLGPFPVERVVGPLTYKLILPEILRSHRTFNVDQLKQSFGCPLEFMGRPIRCAAPVLFDE